MNNNDKNLWNDNWNNYMDGLTGSAGQKEERVVTRDQSVTTEQGMPQQADQPVQPNGAAQPRQGVQAGQGAQQMGQAQMNQAGPQPSAASDYRVPEQGAPRKEPIWDMGEVIYPDDQEKQSSGKHNEKKEHRAKKEKGSGPSAGKVIGLSVAAALIFGIVGGGTMFGVQYAGGKIAERFASAAPSAGGKGSSDVEVEVLPEDEEQGAPAEKETPVTAEERGAEERTAVDTSLTMPQASGDTYTVSQIAEMCMPSVVSITNKGVYELQSWFGTFEQESEGAGSGIVIAKTDTELIIATNNHVVAGAKELSVCVGDSEDQVYAAYVKGTDAPNDLAVVAVNLQDIPAEVMEKISIAAMGDSDALKVGEDVVAIGNALGYGQSVTTGIVSALDREITIDDMTAKLIQTDAAINPGNSGGALFNMKGEVVGINSAKFASAEIEGMGYAIPISVAKPILSELESRQTRTVVDKERQGRLGINVITVSSESAQAYNLPLGVYVTGVEEDSAARRAGMKESDIIVKFDGITMQSADALVEELTKYEAGETVEVVVMRMSDGGYVEKTLKVTLQAPSDAQAAEDTEQNTGRRRQDEEEPAEEEDEPYNYGNDYHDWGSWFGGMPGFNFGW